MDHHNTLTNLGHVDRAPDSASAAQSHFPELAPQMPNMRMTHALQSDNFNAFSQSQERRLNIWWQAPDFPIDNRPERFNRPGH